MKAKNFSASRILKFTACALLVPGLIIALFSIATPAVISNEVTDNKIDCTTTIQYEAAMKRSSLYPVGGIAPPEGNLIAKIATAVIFTVDSSVAAGVPVDVEFTGRYLLKISSEGLWERDWDYSDKHTFTQNTANASLYSEKITVNIANLDKYIKQIEDETGVIQERYIISLVPDIKGTIKYQDKSFPLEPIPVAKLSYSGGLIQPVTETNTDGKTVAEFPRITAKTFMASHVSTSINTFWGTGIPISVTRLIFIPIVLLICCYLSYGPVARLLASRARLSPAMRINRKFKSRIITVMERPKTVGKATVEFHSFQELMHMADQKELPILSHDGGDDIIVYFLIDPTAIYCYKADNTPAVIQGTILLRLTGKGESTNVQ